MCRTGGRRCPNAGGRSTQTTRQAVHRARRALQAAELTGDPATIDAAQRRFDAASESHLAALEAAHHRELADHSTGTTDLVPDHPTDRKNDKPLHHTNTPHHDRDVTADPTPPQVSTKDDGGQHQGDGFNHVGTVHGKVHTYGDVYGDTTTFHIRTTTATAAGRDAASAGDDRAQPAAERTTRRAADDTAHVHGDVHQWRDTYHLGPSRSFTVSNANIATGNPTVGSRHHTTPATTRSHSATGSTGDVTDHDSRTTPTTPIDGTATGHNLHEAAQADLRARLRRVKARRRTRNT